MRKLSIEVRERRGDDEAAARPTMPVVAVGKELN